MNYDARSHYNSMDVKTLRKQCSSRRIKYCHKMSKTKMIEMLLKNDNDANIIEGLETKIKCYVYHTKWVSNNRALYNVYRKICERQYRVSGAQTK